MPQLAGAPPGMEIPLCMREEIARAVADTATQPDVVFVLGTVLISSAVVITAGHYPYDAVDVASRIEEYIENRLVFDFSHVEEQPEPDVAVPEQLNEDEMDLIENDSSLSNNSSLRRSFSDSDLSSRTSKRSQFSLINQPD